MTTPAPARGWLAGRRVPLRARIDRWFLARRPPSDALELTQRNVYIVPTRAGWMLAATLLLLLVASIYYQLNLVYLLPFLLVVASSSFVYVALADLIPQLQKRLGARETIAQILWLCGGIALVGVVSAFAHTH